MKRREFITLVGGAALLPLSVRAQQADRIYRIGVLTLGANGELLAQQRAVFTKTLLELGWTEGKKSKLTTAGQQTTSLKFRHSQESF